MGIEIANHASNKLSRYPPRDQCTVLIDILRGVNTNYICHLCTI